MATLNSGSHREWQTLSALIWVISIPFPVSYPERSSASQLSLKVLLPSSCHFYVGAVLSPQWYLRRGHSRRIIPCGVSPSRWLPLALAHHWAYPSECQQQKKGKACYDALEVMDFFVGWLEFSQATNKWSTWRKWVVHRVHKRKNKETKWDR